jgi:ribosomal protein S18 acetylase RimI-like enzyme
MIDHAFLANVAVQPLDRATHDRATFSSSVPRIDNYLRNNAGKNASADYEKVYVACRRGESTILGYYVICPHAVDIESLPDQMRRKMPRRPTVSAFYLSIIATDASVQRRGLGRFLMAHAFRRCVAAANEAGGHFLVLDALNEDAARFYRSLGFEALPTHDREKRMMISMAKVRKAVERAAKD